MKVVDVIRKLETLGDPARNSNAAEAKVAREKAMELRKKYNLERADLNERKIHPQWNWEINPDFFDGFTATATAATGMKVTFEDLAKVMAKIRKSHLFTAAQEGEQFNNLQEHFRKQRVDAMRAQEAALRRAAKIAKIQEYEKQKKEDEDG